MQGALERYSRALLPQNAISAANHQRTRRGWPKSPRNLVRVAADAVDSPNGQCFNESCFRDDVNRVDHNDDHAAAYSQEGTGRLGVVHQSIDIAEHSPATKAESSQFWLDGISKQVGAQQAAYQH